MENKRPLDLLDSCKNKEIEVSIKDGRKVTGKLVAFDLHLNMYIEDARIYSGKEHERLGSVLIRGDAVVMARKV